MKRFGKYYHCDVKYSYLEDIPEGDLVEKCIYIIGEKKYYWCIIFNCPCGCKDKIQLNILKHGNPLWTFFIKKRTISIYPSIWREVNCRSHFIIRKSRVIMVKEYKEYAK